MSAPPPPSSAGTPACTRPDDFRSAKSSATKRSSSAASDARFAETGPSWRAISTAERILCVEPLAVAGAFMRPSSRSHVRVVSSTPPLQSSPRNVLLELPDSVSYCLRKGFWRRGDRPRSRGYTICTWLDCRQTAQGAHHGRRARLGKLWTILSRRGGRRDRLLAIDGADPARTDRRDHPLQRSSARRAANVANAAVETPAGACRRGRDLGNARLRQRGGIQA